MVSAPHAAIRTTFAFLGAIAVLAASPLMDMAHREVEGSAHAVRDSSSGPELPGVDDLPVAPAPREDAGEPDAPAPEPAPTTPPGGVAPPPPEPARPPDEPGATSPEAPSSGKPAPSSPSSPQPDDEGDAPAPQQPKKEKSAEKEGTKEDEPAVRVRVGDAEVSVDSTLFDALFGRL
ncbi:MAG TPA: hypothetical protein VM582_05600 [Candidatus Thermoplasmatota archaeon]|nr:hypothetical protein [Candidatus Thermoplasmatota archaeon]